MRLLLVTPVGSYRTGDFLDAALGLGCEVVVVTDAEPAIAGSALALSLADAETATTQVLNHFATQRWSGAEEIAGVVGTDGAAVAVAAAVARRLGLPANAAAALDTAADKLRQRRAAHAAGVPQPRFAAITGATMPSWSMYPAVLKPLDRAASQGVVRVEEAAALPGAIESVRDIVGAEAPLLIEQFVPGVEVALEGVLRQGRLEVLTIFDKPDTPSGPTFPETLLISPARLGVATRQRVIEVVSAALMAVGLMEGPVHVECKVHGDAVWFLELAARTIGGWCSRSLRPGGMTLEELVIRHALGLPTPTSPGEESASGVLMLPVPHSGRVARIEGVTVAEAVPGIVEVAMAVGVGQWVQALPAGDRYLGFVFARAATAPDVERALRTAWSTFEIDIDTTGRA